MANVTLTSRIWHHHVRVVISLISWECKASKYRMWQEFHHKVVALQYWQCLWLNIMVFKSLVIIIILSMWQTTINM